MQPTRIYVAADDQVREQTMRALNGPALSVNSFPLPQALIVSVHLEPPDFVVMQWGMPGPSALDILSMLRPGKKTTVIALLDPAQLDQRERLNAAGLVTMMLPVQPAELLGQVSPTQGAPTRARGRRSAVVPVVVTFQGSRIRGFTTDVSPDSLGLHLHRGLPLQQGVVVRLIGQQDSFDLAGTVVSYHVVSEEHRVSVKLAPLTPPDRERLRGLADQFIPAQGLRIMTRTDESGPLEQRPPFSEPVER